MSEHAPQQSGKSRLCLVPTGMTGIQALNVTVFLRWLQQGRQTGGKVTSPQPLKHALLSQGL